MVSLTWVVKLIYMFDLLLLVLKVCELILFCLIIFTVDIVNATRALSATLNCIPTLTYANFKTWKNKVNMFLGCMDLDYAFRESCPPPLTDRSSSQEQRTSERWERSNRVSLMIMKNAIPESFLCTMSEDLNAKEFLETLEKRFAKSDKAEIGFALRKLITMRYKGEGNIREYVLEMLDMAGKLKELKVELPEEFLVNLVLISLPPPFRHFEISYICQNNKWTVNELISHLVQEDERIKQLKVQSAHLASTSSPGGKKRKGKEAMILKSSKKKCSSGKEQKKNRSFFCKDSSHQKKDCPNYHDA